MDDLIHLDKLIEEQKNVLEQNKNVTKQRQNLQADYCKLKDRLNTLADQTSHNFMVPVGSVGFFPGKLLHTNEIMVLLGDNWFVERSTKQAQEIINRRLKLINIQLNDLKKEYDNIKSQQDFAGHFKETKEAEDVQEIREEISQELPYSKSRIRKAHVPNHNLFPRCVDLKKVVSKDVTIDHDELLARLNELEHEEFIAEELEHINAMNMLSVSPNCKELDSEERHVKFKSVNENFDYENIKQDDVSSNKNLICDRAPECPIFNSPADIYEKVFHSHQDLDDKPLKSILKKDSRSNSSENLRLKPILKSSPEHNSVSTDHLVDDRKIMLKTPPDAQFSEQRPGTPENMLFDDPRSILKLHSEAFRSKQSSEMHFDDTFDAKVSNFEQVIDEKRSILKNPKEHVRPMTPEDELHKGILKSEPKKVVIKSPESNPIGCQSDQPVNFTDCKSAFKNQKAFSGTVFERNIQCKPSETNQQCLSYDKPVSKFKASRLKK